MQKRYLCISYNSICNFWKECDKIQFCQQQQSWAATLFNPNSWFNQNVCPAAAEFLSCIFLVFASKWTSFIFCLILLKVSWLLSGNGHIPLLVNSWLSWDNLSPLSSKISWENKQGWMLVMTWYLFGFTKNYLLLHITSKKDFRLRKSKYAF